VFSDLASYKGKILDPLIDGDYHLIATDKDGNQYESYYSFNGHVGLPIIPASSFKYRFDQDGNFIWEWSVPYYLDPSLETSVWAMIKIYQGDDNIGSVGCKLPTHLGRLFVPYDVIDMVKAEGDLFELQIQLRTNDRNNKIYSKSVNLKFPKPKKEKE